MEMYDKEWCEYEVGNLLKKITSIQKIVDKHRNQTDLDNVNKRKSFDRNVDKIITRLDNLYNEIEVIEFE